MQHMLVGLQGQTQQGAQGVSGLWQTASSVRNSICSFAADHKVPGVRLNATKFLEQTVIMFTAETVPVLAPGTQSIRQQSMQSLHGILTPAAVSHFRMHECTTSSLIPIFCNSSASSLPLLMANSTMDARQHLSLVLRVASRPFTEAVISKGPLTHTTSTCCDFMLHNDTADTAAADA